jgi:hypothetical protein
MKKFAHVVILVGGLALLMSAVATAGSKVTYFKGTSVEIIEQNLAIALETPSPGMQASASQTVRDLKALLPEQEFSHVIIPLMRIVKDENAAVPVRTLAALALHELNSSRGNFAIERVALFSSNERMRHLCTWLVVGKNAPQAATVPVLNLSDAR